MKANAKQSSTVLHVVGARPNFMKVAPVHRALRRFDHIHQVLVHTGQHYDVNMSDAFFRQLAIPAPDVNLAVGSRTHAQQTAEIMTRLEPVLVERNPSTVLVYGDVNSTVAATLVCSKMGIPIAHVEAGLRSFDREMPEEINRLITDQLSDLLFTPSEDGNHNLLREGVPSERIHLVGNVMIDTLVRMLPEAQRFAMPMTDPLALVTLHRPSNVDDTRWLTEAVRILADLSHKVTVIFPVHPRTRAKLDEIGFRCSNGLRLLSPLPYVEFVGLLTRAVFVITDSGGIQEETTFLGVPCLTMRENTERPVTVNVGTNQLIGRDLNRLERAVEDILTGRCRKGTIPPFWDGHAADRISQILLDSFGNVSPVEVANATALSLVRNKEAANSIS